MYPHRIRLRGPWECEPLARSAGDERPLPAPGRMTIPGRWVEGGLGDFRGTLRFRRRFGYPGQIDTYERVWLTFAGVEGKATIALNDRPLAAPATAGPFAYEVTSLLRPRNELVVDVEADTATGGLWGEVALEVRCTAYLSGVRVWRERSAGGFVLHATGQVLGTAERPLDLYVLLDRRTMVHTTIEAAPEGKPFAVVSEPLGPEQVRDDAAARVELVDAATVWYVVETMAPLSRSP